MFGFGKHTPSEDPQRAAAIEQSKKVIRDLIHAMADASPEESERLAQQVKDRCGGDTLLPFDFKQKAFKKARELQCNANMRAADRLMHQAARLAAEENMKDRGAKVAEARRYFAKACTLGADEEWRKAFQRLNETILLTGGVQHKGPTRAKPLDTAPKPPNRAKM
ncbi:MAG: hypothetical protein M0006_14650 [Magnetospirillum sp.]|nr:hypothetical protein [Magnetospirillum sp.]